MINAPLGFLAYDAVTRVKIEEIPFTTFEWEETLNRPGSMTGLLPAYHPLAIPTIVGPDVTAIYVDMNGECPWGGIVWTNELTDQADTYNYQVGGEGIWSYYKANTQGDNRRPIESTAGMTHNTAGGPTDVTFTGIDPFLVVTDLMAHAAAVAGSANIGFDAVRFHGPGAGGLSGQAWTKTWNTYDDKGIAEACEEMAQADTTGFDFAVLYEWDTTTRPPTPRQFLDLYYPRRGVMANLLLEAGKNISIPHALIDGTATANKLKGRGSGSGDAQLTSLQDAPAVRPPTGRYPYLRGHFDITDEAIQANLDARTISRLAHVQIPRATVTVNVRADADMHFGDVNVGDSLPLVAQVPGSKFVLDGLFRIITQRYKQATEGPDTWTLELAPDDASTGV